MELAQERADESTWRALALPTLGTLVAWSAVVAA
jgi:hypothetical protein